MIKIHTTCDESTCKAYYMGQWCQSVCDKAKEMKAQVESSEKEQKRQEKANKALKEHKPKLNPSYMGRNPSLRYRL